MQNQNYLRNKRLRLFGGPNGSGKSTILSQIDKRFDIGYYINADDIEQELKRKSFIDLKKFGITLSQIEFDQFLNSHTIISKSNDEGLSTSLTLENNKISSPSPHSYTASLISDLIRHQLLDQRKKFTFESVMSHYSKIEFLKKSLEYGYRNYLYYISTESPIINNERVKQRVKLGGHPVSKDKIESRYYKSLGLLKEAVQYTHRTFIFDNSENEAKLILEIFNGEEVIYKYPEIPKWIDKFLLH